MHILELVSLICLVALFGSIIYGTKRWFSVLLFIIFLILSGMELFLYTILSFIIANFLLFGITRQRTNIYMFGMILLVLGIFMYFVDLNSLSEIFIAGFFIVLLVGVFKDLLYEKKIIS